MSEPAPERPRAVPARTTESTAGGNLLTRKVAGLPGWAWVGIIMLGGVTIWYIYKSRQASSSASSTSAATGSGCTDTSGDSVPCDQTDYGGEIATLQTEIQDLQQGSASSASSGTVTVPNVTGITVEQATSILGAAGLKASGPQGVADQIHTVTAQDPKAGTKVPKGSAVSLDYKTATEKKQGSGSRFTTSAKIPPGTKTGQGDTRNRTFTTSTKKPPGTKPGQGDTRNPTFTTSTKKPIFTPGPPKKK